jgi:hypothetical protein
MTLRLLIFPLLLLSTTLVGQNSDLGNWLIYFGNYRANEKWNWHHEVQYRNYNAIGDLEQLLLRTGLGYNLSENNNNILAGYGYILSENYLSNQTEKVVLEEHRLFQQFITHQRSHHIQLQHRYRLEQRWIGEDFKWRFRYFLSLQLPLLHLQERDRFLYLSLYNEIFLQPGQQPFDRNRLYGGLGYQWSDSVKMELGYMNQFLFQDHRDQINWIVFLLL